MLIAPCGLFLFENGELFSSDFLQVIVVSLFKRKSPETLYWVKKNFSCSNLYPNRVIFLWFRCQTLRTMVAIIGWICISNVPFWNNISVIIQATGSFTNVFLPNYCLLLYTRVGLHEDSQPLLYRAAAERSKCGLDQIKYLMLNEWRRFLFPKISTTTRKNHIVGLSAKNWFSNKIYSQD